MSSTRLLKLKSLDPLIYEVEGVEVAAKEFYDSNGVYAWYVPFNGMNHVVKYEKDVKIEELDNHFFMKEEKISR